MHGTLTPTRRHGGQILFFLLGLAAAAAASANPRGAQIVHGSAVFAQPNAQTLEITNSPSAILNWQSFDIGAGETTRFIQESAASAVLNRVTTHNSSEIFGNLLSNGRVFLINPAGILIGRDATVDTAGLVMSTLNMTDEDFLAGRLRFAGDASSGALVNRGYIKSGPGGEIILIAPHISNEAVAGRAASGLVESDDGTLILAAGEAITIASLDDPDISFEVQAPAHEVVNLGKLLAAGGTVGVLAGTILQAGEVSADTLTIDAAGRVLLAASSRVVLEQNSLTTASSSGGGSGGEVAISAVADDAGGRIYQMGSVRADGNDGGSVALAADRILTTAGASARGDIDGGDVTFEASDEIIATNGAFIDVSGGSGAGGGARLDGGGGTFSSGQIQATGMTGGNVEVLGDDVTLAAATIDASGVTGGGRVRIGGGYQGGEGLPAAVDVEINDATVIKADANVVGDGGSVVVWSDGTTRYAGTISARGGAAGGDGGEVEVSGKTSLGFTGQVDVGADKGAAGSLLLDPKNLYFTSENLSGVPISVLDPHPGAGNLFGQTIQFIDANGFNTSAGFAVNLVVYESGDDFGAANAGAVYVYRLSDGALLSSLTGSNPGDAVGNNFLQNIAGVNILRSTLWNGSRGAVTLFNPVTGTNGVIGSNNSLVGATALDQIGSFGVQSLGGNVLAVRSPNFGGGLGAFTFGSTTSLNGVVSASNSLVGVTTIDQVGFNAAQFVGSTNYVLRSNNNGAGAVTFINPLVPPTGPVTFSNSLVGTATGIGGDNVGGTLIQSIAGNMYAVHSASWNGGAGALTLGSVATGVSGVVSSGNSLLGSAPGDAVGANALQSLFNGNYLLRSNLSGFGAVTFIAPGAAPLGAVDNTNSLVGTSAGDQIGLNPAIQISGDTWAVVAPNWDATAINTDAGAVSFLNASNGTFAGTATPFKGDVSSTNSLTGSLQGDMVGSNGVGFVVGSSYGVFSPNWQSGGIGNTVGAITWFAPGSAVNGAVSGANSLIGSTNGDAVGASTSDAIRGFASRGIYSLFNGNALLKVPTFANDTGAVVFLDGSGVLPTGVIDDTKALVGSDPGDQIGSNGIEIMSGYYIVLSPFFGTSSEHGAVTVVDAMSGLSDTVGLTNSLLGAAAGDHLGSGGLFDLDNGNALILSPDFNSAGGGVTFLDLNNGHVFGDTDFAATVGATNTLVGSAGDQVGLGGIEVHTNASFQDFYFVLSPSWDAGGATPNGGAVTIARTDTGTAGTVNASNSVVGGAGDEIGSGGIFPLWSGNALIHSPEFQSSRGAVTFVELNLERLLSDTDFANTVSSSNSLIGASANDDIGSDGIIQFFDGDTSDYYYGVFSPAFAAGAGAVTFVNSDSGLGAIVSTGNSITGTAPGDQVGLDANYHQLDNYKVLLLNPQWNGNRGAVTFVDLGVGSVTGQIDDTNSVVGTTAGDLVGSDGIEEIFDQNFNTVFYAILSPHWINGGLSDAGAITWGDPASGTVGQVAVGNSLVGGNAGDLIGDCCSLDRVTGNLWVAEHFDWDGGKSALTFFDVGGLLGDLPVGEVDLNNSLLGSTTGDALGNSGIFAVSTAGGTWVMVESPNWSNGVADNAGAITVFRPADGINGVLDDSNSLVGTQADDFVGGGFQLNLSTSGHRLFVTSTWSNDRGAVTFWNTNAAITGIVGIANSLVGGNDGDLIGDWDVSTTSGGRYYVAAPDWNGDMGAITFGSQAIGVFGEVSAANSLVGSTAGDRVGENLFSNFASNNLISIAEDWNGNRGAITILNPTAPHVGAVSAANSLVGSSAGDFVGDTFTTLFSTDNQGLLVFRTNSWNSNSGAVTVVNVNSPIVGAVSGSNSLIGKPGDLVGNGGVSELSNGSVLVRSTNWSDGTAQNFGAATLMRAASRVRPVTGFVSAANSLVGSHLNDFVGNGSFNTLSTGNIILRSPNWNGNAGALTFINITDGRTGVVSGNNSLVGVLPNDFIGSGGISFLGGDRYLVRSPNASVNGLAGAGRIDIVDGATTRAINGDIGFDSSPGGELFVSIQSVINFLNSGATLKLQATNDIFIPAGSGFVADRGALFLEAGRGIDIAGDLIVRNGSLSLLANAPLGDGAFRDAGDGNVTIHALDQAVLVLASVLSVEAQNIVLEAGSAPGASVALVGLGSTSVHAHGSGLLSLSAGTAHGSSLLPGSSFDIFESYLNAPAAFTAPAAFIIGREALAVTADDVVLNGGGSTGAFAALASFGEFSVEAINIELNPGHGENADAVLLGLGGLADIRYSFCNACDSLFGDPLLDPLPQGGIFISGVLQNPAGDAILAMLGQGSDEGADEDDDDDEEEETECN